MRTVNALLTAWALARLGNAPHFFCADPACDTGELIGVVDEANRRSHDTGEA